MNSDQNQGPREHTNLRLMSRERFARAMTESPTSPQGQNFAESARFGDWWCQILLWPQSPYILSSSHDCVASRSPLPGLVAPGLQMSLSVSITIIPHKSRNRFLSIIPATIFRVVWSFIIAWLSIAFTSRKVIGAFFTNYANIASFFCTTWVLCVDALKLFVFPNWSFLGRICRFILFLREMFDTGKHKSTTNRQKYRE